MLEVEAVVLVPLKELVVVAVAVQVYKAEHQTQEQQTQAGVVVVTKESRLKSVVLVEKRSRSGKSDTSGAATRE